MPTTSYRRRRLALIVTRVTDRLTHVRVTPMPDAALLPLLEVSGSLVRGCLDAARGVLAMADLREYGGIVAAERSAWKCGMTSSTSSGTENPPVAAVKVQVNGLFEVLGLLDSIHYDPMDLAERSTEAIAKFERDFPDVVRAVREQRQKRKFHWSGRTRSAIVAPGDANTSDN